MPFVSTKQRRYLWSNKPELARRWADKYGSDIKPKKGLLKKNHAVKRKKKNG